MKTRILGRTELEVSEIGYGAWRIGGAMWAESDDKQSIEALEKALHINPGLQLARNNLEWTRAQKATRTRR